MSEVDNITDLLVSSTNGDRAAVERLMPLVYRELKKLAAGFLRRESNAQTLQPTSLVHEAYLRLIDQKQVQWRNRSHFFAIAAQMMRRILVDSARAKCADKRGSGKRNLSLDDVAVAAAEEPDCLLALDEALERLRSVDERKVKLVELRYFVGLSIEEAAEALEISPATAKRDWEFARAFLASELVESE